MSNVLSLFNGISCGRLAFERAGIKVDRYVSYEIDEFANSVAKKHFPNDEYNGDVCTADFTQYRGFDYVVGGSPCQDLSIAGTKKGLEGDQSKLFYEFIRALKEVKPKFYLLENNASMTKENQDLITSIVGGGVAYTNKFWACVRSRAKALILDKHTRHNTTTRQRLDA